MILRDILKKQLSLLQTRFWLYVCIGRGSGNSSQALRWYRAALRAAALDLTSGLMSLFKCRLDEEAEERVEPEEGAQEEDKDDGVKEDQAPPPAKRSRKEVEEEEREKMQ